MREGGCLCGSVRYRVDGDPVSSGICHCVTCRRAASAPALPFAQFAVSDFSFTRGEPAAFRSSPHVVRTFCGRCGSPLTYQNDRHATSIDIMTCSLDDPNTLPPTFSVWVSHKVAWDAVAEGLPAYAESRSEPAD
ncbi:GFA family protein [Lichenifustis flavocetrariae]|uniref:GFA family protein n=1 Tax=Lichenifustis flavocetrariae TaxID=2949735 RepID=A0AA41Z501_9HYPH|nr:GFA family protein [Lichenifustis flavocetrariae]MCW6510405.1 GFA family protein [Lichenifustis flavocetrariae]